MFRVGLIGYGYWGPNLARNFNANPVASLIRIADLDEKRRKEARRFNPHAEITENANTIIEGKDIDIVVISTPVSTHYDFAINALKNGKHVWIEKPIASNSRQAEEIAELAEKTGLTAIVDHTFLFTSAVQTIKKYIDQEDFGDLLYFDSIRINLGLFQHDVNVLWDLATHDLSIVDYLLGPSPKTVSATGSSHYNGMVDVAFLTLDYGNNLLAHAHVNWLSPVKVRKTIVGGNKQMLVWNDLENEETLKIYNKGVDIKSMDAGLKIIPEYRIGDMFVPAMPYKEALAMEVAGFLECIQTQATPINDAKAGLRVVKVLEAADESLKLGGAPVSI
ncbi:MAG: Gfo/Idh/MocA family oxidoreductase [Nitrospinota bacterium]|nr:Gfo/Idh/MocA family oxidoreductase [Nitrospinota bacterium]